MTASTCTQDKQERTQNKTVTQNGIRVTQRKTVTQIFRHKTVSVYTSHSTSLHFTSLHFTSLHFPSLVITFVTLFEKILILTGENRITTLGS
jgi:hypothetical protein